MSLLDVQDLAISFIQYTKGLRRRRLDVVTGLDLEVHPGELVAVVGSSGSGKSLLAHAVLGILPPNAVVSGSITFDGEPLDDKRLRTARGKEIALIPQSVTHLDPVHRVKSQVARAALLTGNDRPERAALEALARRRLAPEVGGLHPHQLSGGMARRVLTATATVGTPRLVLADEPTPGLHPEVVRESLDDLRRLADEGAGVVLITHDLLGALEVADTISVFYAGTTVETVPTEALRRDEIHHPYTRALWDALPTRGFTPLPGSQPTPDRLPPGCLFAERCHMVTDECRTERPSTRVVKRSTVRCIHA